MKQTQQAPGIPIDATVGVPLTITLPRDSQDPGAIWLDTYDASFLKVERTGYQPNYAGGATFWVTFMPLKAGQTQVLIVDQPHLINPLFISREYQVSISA